MRERKVMAESKKNIYQKLAAIQQELNVPKDLRNNFGNYNYRSAEQILEKVKPLLKKHKCTLYMTDGMIEINPMILKTTVVLQDLEDEGKINVQGLALHAEKKKGMDESQITGACSSYARKYALAGMFLLDDNKDGDALNTSAEYTEKPKPAPKKAPQISAAEKEWKKTFDVAAGLSKELLDAGVQKEIIQATIANCNSGKRLKDTPTDELKKVIEQLSVFKSEV